MQLECRVENVSGYWVLAVLPESAHRDHIEEDIPCGEA